MGHPSGPKPTQQLRSKWHHHGMGANPTQPEPYNLNPPDPNPSRTAVPFWGQTTQIPSSLSPKRDCGPKRANPNPGTKRPKNGRETQPTAFAFSTLFYIYSGPADHDLPPRTTCNCKIPGKILPDIKVNPRAALLYIGHVLTQPWEDPQKKKKTWVGVISIWDTDLSALRYRGKKTKRGTIVNTW